MVSPSALGTPIDGIHHTGERRRGGPTISANRNDHPDTVRRAEPAPGATQPALEVMVFDVFPTISRQTMVETGATRGRALWLSLLDQHSATGR